MVIDGVVEPLLRKYERAECAHLKLARLARRYCDTEWHSTLQLAWARHQRLSSTNVTDCCTWCRQMSSGISSAFYDLPFLVKCVILPLAFLLVCSVLRIIANRIPSQSPPVFEGIPFIGGVLKFVQV